MPICMGPAAQKPFCPDVRPRRVVLAVIGLHFSDPGKQRNRAPRLLPGLLEQGEVVRGGMEWGATVVTAGWVVAPEPEEGHPTPAANSMLAPPTIAMGTTATAVTSSPPDPMAGAERQEGRR